MATNNYFPRKSESAPMIYAYEDKYDPNLKGLLKVGYTTVGAQHRVNQHYNRASKTFQAPVQDGDRQENNSI